MKYYALLLLCILSTCHISEEDEIFTSRAARNAKYMRLEPEAETIRTSDTLLGRSKRFFTGRQSIAFGGGPCRYDNYRNGSCMMASQCRLLGGKFKTTTFCGNTQTASAGFCCLLEDTCGDIQSGRNNTLFINPEYPEYNTEPQRCELTVPVKGACFIRLDFTNFTIHGPVNGSCVVDQFHIPELMNLAPMICGYNNNTHMYLDVRELNLITIRVNIGEWNGKRRWSIQLTRHECDDEWTPKPGCLQQLFTKTDIVKSFNYDDHNPKNSSLLAGLDYSVCIHQALDQCYVQWSAEDFHMSNANGTAMLGDKCGSENYLLIQEGYDIAKRQVTFDRFCGDRLSAIAKSNKSSNVYSASAPFQIRVRTARRQSNMSRGFLLRYNQLLCFDPPVNGINFRNEFEPLAWLERFRIW